MRRRTLLTAIGSGTVSLAGCTTTGSVPTTTRSTSGDQTATTGDQTALPEECPTSRGLDAEWPTDLDASTVRSFVEEYEHAYYRDIVVEYEPESQLDSYELNGSVTAPPREAGNGWKLAYSGSGGIYRPTLALGAEPTDPPDEADVVPVSGITEQPVREMLSEAADAGEAEYLVEPPGENVDRHIELFASLSDDFERLSGRGDSDTLYVDVDGTTVELTVAATNLHGDYWWDAWYYVDEQVVRRTTDENTDPRTGELLECRDRT